MTSGHDYESVNSALEKSCTDKIKLKAVSDTVLNGFYRSKWQRHPLQLLIIRSNLFDKAKISPFTAVDVVVVVASDLPNMLFISRC